MTTTSLYLNGDKINNFIVYPDDTVADLKSAMAEHMGVTDQCYVYIWGTQKISDIHDFRLRFIQFVFKSTSVIDAALFKYIFEGVFGVKIPTFDTPMLTKMDVESFMNRTLDTVTIPISLDAGYMPGRPDKYDNEMWEMIAPRQGMRATNSSTIETLGSFTEIHVYITVKQISPLQLPFTMRSHVGIERNLIADVQNPRSKIEPNLRQVHIRVNPSNAVSLDMFTIFAAVRAQIDLPFAKLMLTGDQKVLFKVSRRFMQEVAGGIKKVKAWTSFTSKRSASGNRFAKDMIMMKYMHPDLKTPINLVLYSSGAYDVKFNLNGIPSADADAFMATTLSHIHTKICVPTMAGVRHSKTLVFTNVFSAARHTDIRVLKSVADDRQIVYNTKLSGNDVVKRIIGMNHLFHVVEYDPIKNNVAMVYKRTHAFTSDANMLNMISKIKNPDGIDVAEVRKMFNMRSSEDVDEIIARHKSMARQGFIQYHRTENNMVVVRVHVRNNGYVCTSENSASREELERICRSIMYTLTSKSVKPAAASTSIKGVFTLTDAVVDEENLVEDDFGDDDFGEAEDAAEEAEEEAEEADETHAVLGETISKIKQSMVCPTVPEIRGGTNFEYRQLQNSDKALFTYVHNQVGNYATQCQSNSKKQPNVFAARDYEYNQKCFPGAADTGGMSFGSTAALKARNKYVCPQVWCPTSRVAMTLEQFERYGKKCPFPDVVETPVIVEQTRNVSGTSRVNPMNNEKMPCCFLKLKRNEDGTYVFNAKTDRSPVNRYSMLPEPVVDFFGKENFNGLVKGQLKKTTKGCLLRFGVTTSNVQPLLDCLVAVLKFKIERLAPSIDFITFMTADKGQLFKRFVPKGDDDYNRFDEFKAWMQSHTADFRRKIGVDDATFNIIRQSSDFHTRYIGMYVHAQRVHRMYRMFMAYRMFQDYLLNEEVPKHHEHIIPVLNNVNPSGHNIIVIEKQNDWVVRLDPDTYNTQKGCIFIINNGIYYEPVYRVFNVKDNNHDCVIPADDPISRRMSAYAVSNRRDLGRSFRVKAATEFDTQVIDFDMQVIGLFSSDGFVVPLPQPCPVDIGHPSSIVFIDHFLEKLDVPDRNKQITRITDYTQYYSKNARVASTSDDIIVFRTIKMPVPLGPKFKQSQFWTNTVANGAIFDEVELTDERTQHIDDENFKEALFIATFNEVVALYHTVPAIRDEIDFVRNPVNPLSRAVRYDHLKSVLDAPLARAVYATRREKPGPLPYGTKPICSVIKDKAVCKANKLCGWMLDDMKDTTVGKCKVLLNVADKDYVMQRVLYHVINLSSVLEQTALQRHVVDHDTIEYDTYQTDFIERHVEYMNNDQRYQPLVPGTQQQHPYVPPAFKKTYTLSELPALFAALHLEVKGWPMDPTVFKVDPAKVRKSIERMSRIAGVSTDLGNRTVVCPGYRTKIELKVREGGRSVFEFKHMNVI